MNDNLELHPDIIVRMADLISECRVDRSLEMDNFVLAEYLVNCLENLYNALDMQDCSEASKYPDRAPRHLRGHK